MFYEYESKASNPLFGKTAHVQCTSEMSCDYTLTEWGKVTKKQRIFSLDQIPDAMVRRNMPVGAAMMRRWFSQPARAMTLNEKRGLATYPSHLIDTGIITMDWVLNYQSTRSAYETLRRSTYLTTPNARQALLRRIKRAGLFNKKDSRSSTYVRLNNVPALHRDWQFQFIEVGGVIDNVYQYTYGADDLYAALANFILCAAPSIVDLQILSPTVWLVEVPEVAIYVRDTYDFFDEPGNDQYLGHWNASDLKMSLGMHRTIMNDPGLINENSFYFPIRNSSFKNWQIIRGKGGDFIAFSDVRKEIVSGGGVGFTVNQGEIDAI